MSGSQHPLSGYPNVRDYMAYCGPETLSAFSNAVDTFYRYKQTCAVVEGNLRILEQKFQDHAEARRSAENIFYDMLSMVKEMIELAKLNPDNPDIIKQILPMYIHCLNKTPDFQRASLEYLKELNVKFSVIKDSN